jgi:hypothetical protein
MPIQMSEAEWLEFAAKALVCRSCFWAAQVTKVAEKVWCAHATHHGWMSDVPACSGKEFRYELRNRIL